MKKIISGILGVTILAGAFGAGANIQLGLTPKVNLDNIAPSPELAKVLDWVKPTTDAEWVEDVKEEQLNVKHDYQLDAMLIAHQEKLVRTASEKAAIEKYPDALRFELEKQGMDPAEIEKQVTEKVNYWRWKTEKLEQSIERIAKEIELRDTKKVDRTDEILGTTYYIDSDCASPGTGLTKTCDGAGGDDPFDDIDDFTDAARSAGDIAWLKRGTTATYDDGSDVTFTSDGNLNNPITLSADYDNIFGNFATSTQTYTPVAGSNTMTASANISDIAAGDWIYVYGDQWEDSANPTLLGKDYAYEVRSVSGTTLTLYLPYKGIQSGSGNSLRILPDAPVWNTAAGDFQWVMSTDNWWFFQGIQIQGTDVACTLGYSSNAGLIVKDMIILGNGASDCGVAASSVGVKFLKIRMANFSSGFNSSSRAVDIIDGYIDCSSVASSEPFSSGTGNMAWMSIIDVSITGCARDLTGSGLGGTVSWTFRNFRHANSYNGVNAQSNFPIYYYDDFGIVQNDWQTSNKMGAATTPTTTIRTTVNLRSGGGLVNALFLPPSGTGNTGVSTRFWPYSFFQLFEYPIYADTSSKTYSIFFNSTSTDHFTTDPTASQFWIECDYYADASDADRITKKSTGVIDFNGSTAWQSLSVTCQPTQTGVLYLRGYYGMPRDTGADDTNAFYMDLKPVIQ